MPCSIRTAADASRDLLARLDGSGSFIASADLHAGSDVKTFIDDRRAARGAQIDQDFRAAADGGPAGRRAGDRRRPQLQHRRHRHAATSPPSSMRSTPTVANGAQPAEPADSGQLAGLVQPEPGNALEHDPQPDRHADDDADAAADGHVGRPRARAGDVRPAAGDAVPPGRDHGGQGAAVDADRPGAGDDDPCWWPSSGSASPSPARS